MKYTFTVICDECGEKVKLSNEGFDLKSDSESITFDYGRHGNEFSLVCKCGNRVMCAG